MPRGRKAAASVEQALETEAAMQQAKKETDGEKVVRLEKENAALRAAHQQALAFIQDIGSRISILGGEVQGAVRPRAG